MVNLTGTENIYYMYVQYLRSCKIHISETSLSKDFVYGEDELVSGHIQTLLQGYGVEMFTKHFNKIQIGNHSSKISFFQSKT